MSERRQTVVLLHGEPGAGKDAVAEILIKHHDFTRLAFADKLKEMCEDLDPIVDTYEAFEQITYPNGSTEGHYTHRPLRLSDAVYGPSPEGLLWHQSRKFALGWDGAKREYPEVRRTQQRLATEVIRKHVSDTFWAAVVLNQVLDAFPAPVVITDMRFQSELDMMTANRSRADVRVWWVKRPDNPHRVTGDNAQHVSETWHPEHYDACLNDGTLVDLGVEVERLLELGRDPS